jgi:predicted Zn-dependent protease
MLAVPSPRCSSLRHFAHGKPSRTVPIKCIGCALLLFAFSGRLLTAQVVPGSPNANGIGRAGSNDPRVRQIEELSNKFDQKGMMDERVRQRPPLTCMLEPFPGLSKTVSVQSLQVPEKVQNEYERACTALRSKKLAESEKHLRKAVQYSPDAFGWVMLGKILEATERWDEARNACTEGVVHDPSYWPAQICLAEIDAGTQRWNASLDESNRAVSLSLESKRFAYFVSAVALFNLDKVSDAESRALEAKRLDVDHQLTSLHLLLAQIDELKGDLRAAETELHDCLKYAKDSLTGDKVKQELARLDSAPN